VTASEKRQYVVFALLGVAGLILKSRYGGPLSAAVHDHGGNFAASFAVFFVAIIGVSATGLGPRAAAVLAFLAVELFEATDGFGVMSNVYDPGDYVANAAGVLLAVVVDRAVRRPRRVGHT
jgi:hypothetical protein